MEAENRNLTSKSFMRNSNGIYLIMLVGMMIFGSIILFTTIPWDATMPTSEDTFLIVVPLFTFIGVVLGQIIYKRKLDSLAEKQSLKIKLQGFQTALIIKYALVELPFMLGVIATFSSNNIFYLLISGTLVMYFITLKPTRNKIKKDLNLSTKMSLQLNDNNQVLN